MFVMIMVYSCIIYLYIITHFMFEDIYISVKNEEKLGKVGMWQNGETFVGRSKFLC